MKASQFFISTLKEAPADAEIVSHKLMMRAGMIKRPAGEGRFALHASKVLIAPRMGRMTTP